MWTPSDDDIIRNDVQYSHSLLQSVVLMSHLGRPDGIPKKEASMAPLVPLLKVRRIFLTCADCIFCASLVLDIH